MGFTSKVFKYLAVLTSLVLFVLCLHYTSVKTYAAEVVCDYHIEGRYIGRNEKPALCEAKITYKNEPFNLQFKNGKEKYKSSGVLALIINNRLVYADGTICEEFELESVTFTILPKKRGTGRGAKYFTVAGNTITVFPELIDCLGLKSGVHKIGAVFDNRQHTRDYDKVDLIIADDYYEIGHDSIQVLPKVKLESKHKLRHLDNLMSEPLRTFGSEPLRIRQLR